MRNTYSLTILFFLLIPPVQLLLGAQKKATKEQEYHIYLKTVDGKKKALKMRIPTEFQAGVKFEEDSEGHTIFLSKNDPIDNWLLMTEHISYRKIENLDFLPTVYTACTRSLINKDSIPEHTLSVINKNGIGMSTAIFARDAIAYRASKDLAICLPKKELIVTKAFQGDGYVILIEYVKRYDSKEAEQELKVISDKAINLFENYIYVTNFNGKNISPDENIKTAQATPDPFKKLWQMEKWDKEMARIK